MSNHEQLESSLEAKVIRESHKRRCECLKLVAVGKYGFPDRTIICPRGRVFFVELKKKKEKAKRRQSWFHKVLRQYGFEVFVVDDINDFINIIEEFLNAC